MALHGREEMNLAKGFANTSLRPRPSTTMRSEHFLISQTRKEFRVYLEHPQPAPYRNGFTETHSCPLSACSGYFCKPSNMHTNPGWGVGRVCFLAIGLRRLSRWDVSSQFPPSGFAAKFLPKATAILYPSWIFPTCLSTSSVASSLLLCKAQFSPDPTHTTSPSICWHLGTLIFEQSGKGAN